MLKVDSIEQYNSEKILGLDECREKISELKRAGKTVGLCHGGFDVTHPGHLRHCQSAKELCDVLVVSITADRFVGKRKGSGRPVYTDALRAYMLASTCYVGWVVVTDFARGTDVIKLLEPTYYIKGPDNIHKNTPGITEERNTIKAIGGEMRYTSEPPMSTTKIIEYIKKEVHSENVLVIVDRDGTLIKDNDFPGKCPDWEKTIAVNDDVVDALYYLQTRARTTMIVVSNQAGVARKYFDCTVVEKINAHLAGKIAKEKNVKFADWQYCPDVDVAYAESRSDLHFDPDFVKEETKRKPKPAMVMDALEKLNMTTGHFTHIFTLGDREEDRLLSDNMGAVFIDVNNKACDEIKTEMETALRNHELTKTEKS